MDKPATATALHICGAIAVTIGILLALFVALSYLQALDIGYGRPGTRPPFDIVRFALAIGTIVNGLVLFGLAAIIELLHRIGAAETGRLTRDRAPPQNPE